MSDEEAGETLSTLTLEPALTIGFLLKFIGPKPSDPGPPGRGAEDDEGANRGGDGGNGEGSVNDDEEEGDEGEAQVCPDSAQEQAGAMLYSLACSPADTAHLMSLGVAQACATLLLAPLGPPAARHQGGAAAAGCRPATYSAASTPRLQELSAGICANLATACPRARAALANDAPLLGAATACFLGSTDPLTLAELCRFFATVLRPPRAPPAAPSEVPPPASARPVLTDALAQGPLSKTCWLLRASCDPALLAAACELLFVVSRCAAPLFAALVGDEDCALPASLSALFGDDTDRDDNDGAHPTAAAAAVLDEFQALPGGARGACRHLIGLVLDTVEALLLLHSPPPPPPTVNGKAEARGGGSSGSSSSSSSSSGGNGLGPKNPSGSPLGTLFPALPALAAAVVDGELPAHPCLDEAVEALAALHAAAAASAAAVGEAMDVDPALAAALLDHVVCRTAGVCDGGDGDGEPDAPRPPSEAALRAAFALLDHQLAAEEAQQQQQQQQQRLLGRNPPASSAATPAGNQVKGGEEKEEGGPTVRLLRAKVAQAAARAKARVACCAGRARGHKSGRRAAPGGGDNPAAGDVTDSSGGSESSRHYDYGEWGAALERCSPPPRVGRELSKLL